MAAACCFWLLAAVVLLAIPHLAIVIDTSGRLALHFSYLQFDSPINLEASIVIIIAIVEFANGLTKFPLSSACLEHLLSTLVIHCRLSHQTRLLPRDSRASSDSSIIGVIAPPWPLHYLHDA